MATIASNVNAASCTFMINYFARKFQSKRDLPFGLKLPQQELEILIKFARLSGKNPYISTGIFVMSEYKKLLYNLSVFILGICLG